jgi:GDPmannose 4,6-dehydratase
MVNKAIIFGSNGQDGIYLTRLLEQKNVKVITVSRKNAIHIGDVSNFDFVSELIKRYKPLYIFHLAANSSTSHDFLFENHKTICDGTLSILESVRLYNKDCKIFLSGSAMQFVNDGNPIDENTSFDPSSAYSIARIHSVYAGRYYKSKFNLKVYVGYFFNHDSELRDERHVNQKIAQTVKRIYAGSKEKLIIGNLDVKKEFNYAGDFVNAIWVLINQDKVSEAVIGSGETYSIREWIEYCFSRFNLKWEEHVELNKSFIPEYNSLCSNPKLIKTLGWQPKTSFYQLANLMLNI